MWSSRTWTAMPIPRDASAERRAAERAAARRLHPDVGGDSAEYQAEMERIAHQYGGAFPAPRETPMTGFSRTRRWNRVRRMARRATRDARAAMPSKWPGARKYGQL